MIVITKSTYHKQYDNSISVHSQLHVIHRPKLSYWCIKTI